jgi:hypothetical protein
VTFGVEWRAFGLSLLLVLALQPIYLAALIATDTIAPADRRARVMAPSMQLLRNAEGDTITECVALAIGLEPNTSALHNAIFAARPIYGKDPCDGLRAAVEKQQDIQWLPYPRYWHGYRVVLDPLTAVFRIRDSQQVILIFLVAALAWFVIELQKIAGDRAALAFIFPTVLLTDLWRMFQITSHALATAFIFAGGALIARKARSGAPLIVTAALLGSVFNFIDFLTNPPWQPMLLAFVTLTSARELLCALQVVSAWSVGYALTWASKWALAVAWGVPWKEIAEVILFRLDGDYGDTISHHLLAPSLKVLPFLFRDIVWQTPAVVILTILAPLLLPDRPPRWRTLATLSLPALIPFAWFELLSNHTQIHPWTVSRPVASAIGIVFAAWIVASRRQDPEVPQRLIVPEVEKSTLR